MRKKVRTFPGDFFRVFVILTADCPASSGVKAPSIKFWHGLFTSKIYVLLRVKVFIECPHSCP
jgi:hypothetical protein